MNGSPELKSSMLRVPDGYAVASVNAAQDDAPLRIGVLVRRKPDVPGGGLVVLRDHLDSRVYLGAIIDADGQVRQWIEVWVQTLAGLKDTSDACRNALTNSILDQRWIRFAEALDAFPAGGCIATTWERRHPPPAWIDIERAVPIHPVDAGSGRCWTLCEDDGRLARHGLPAYGGSCHRYLHAVNEADQATFVPVTPDAPENEHTVPLNEAVPDDGTRTPLNVEGGLMLVRPYYPLHWRGFVDVLGGGEWEGAWHGAAVLDADGSGLACGNTRTPGRLFLETHGLAGRLREALHLKLCLLFQMVRAVTALVQARRQPLLNLGADTFRVRLADTDADLPGLWTFQLAPFDPGGAVVLPIKQTDTQHYLMASEPALSVYRPAEAGVAARGRGTVRIRQVLTDKRRGVVAEGTLQTRDDIPANPHDLVWLRMPLSGQPLDLYANLEEDRALAAGEWRFRSVGQMLTAADTARLQACEGIPMGHVPFDLLPLLRTPCDLYALAVMGIEMLLVNRDTKLSFAVDEMISLARESAVRAAETPELPMRIAALFQKDKRWPQTLGPQRLVCETLTPEDAFSMIPPSVWWDVLAMLVRMLPGIGCDSICRDYGDAPAKAMHEIFQPTTDDLRRLMHLTRGLIVTDWTYSCEIRRAIDTLRKPATSNRIVSERTASRVREDRR